MQVTLKDGRSIVIHPFYDGEEDCIAVYATFDDLAIADGKYDPNRGYFRNIEVIPSFRRAGVASAIYDYIEHDLGFRIERSNNVQPDGQLFWDARSGKRD